MLQLITIILKYISRVQQPDINIPLGVTGRDSIGGVEMALERSPRHPRHHPGAWRNGGAGAAGQGSIR